MLFSKIEVRELHRKLISLILSLIGVGTGIGIAAAEVGGFDNLPPAILEATASAFDTVGLDGAADMIRESSLLQASVNLSELKAGLLTLDDLANMAGIDLSGDAATQLLPAERRGQLNTLIAEINEMISIENLANLSENGADAFEANAMTRGQIDSLLSKLNSGGIENLMSKDEVDRLNALINQVSGLLTPESMEELANSGITMDEVSEQLNETLDILKNQLATGAADSLLPDDSIMRSDGIIDRVKDLLGSLR